MPNQPAENKVSVTVWMDRVFRNRVKARAAERGESVSAVVRRALEEYVK